MGISMNGGSPKWIFGHLHIVSSVMTTGRMEASEAGTRAFKLRESS